MARRAVRTGVVGVVLAAVAVVWISSAVRSPAAGAAAEVRLAPTADASVDASLPGTASGSAVSLVADSSPQRVTYLRFVVANLAGPVTRAQLWLHVQASAAGPGGSVGRVSRVGASSWTESTLTWANRPAVGALVAAPAGAATGGTWVPFEVTAAVTGNGTVELAVTSTSDDGTFYDAREAGAATAPQLRIFTGDAPTPPPTPPATAEARLAPVADTSVDAAAPDAIAGSAATLVADASPERTTYLRFAVTGVGRVTRAQLWLHVHGGATGPSDSVGRASRVVSSSWSEASTTWRNRPAVGALVAAPTGAAAAGAWVPFEVTSAVAGNGTVELAVTSTSPDGVSYDAREAGAATAPQLRIFSTGTVSPPVEPPTPPATGDRELLAAGDVAGCTWDSDELTARILDQHPDVPVAVLGDTVQVAGTAQEFTDCYAPTWGRAKARTHPAIGNHEYLTDSGKAYWDYFGAAAGTRGQGWYSYDLGPSWHVVVLNGNCWNVGGCQVGSPQHDWLVADLAANPRPCTLAYWHQPLFSSIEPLASVKPLWDALYAAKADLVLNGHKHGYERFAPQRGDGTADPVHGIREIVVATGGSPYFYAYGAAQPNSEVRATNLHGVLDLTLSSNSYSWNFLPASDSTFTDRGTTACH